MTRSSAEERGGTNKFLKWRSRKKDLLVAYSDREKHYAKKQLKKLMLYTNQNFDEIQDDRNL